MGDFWNPEYQSHSNGATALSRSPMACGAGVEIGTPILAGIALATHSRRGLTSAAEANGMFIEWIPV
jgi:hypothetical protein